MTDPRWQERHSDRWRNAERRLLERRLRAVEDRLTRAEQAFREALACGEGTRSAREAAGRALDLGPGKRGLRHDAQHVLWDFSTMLSGTGAWAGRPLDAEAAVSELVKLHGWRTRNACLRFLERLRAKLRRDLEAASEIAQREELAWRRQSRGLSVGQALRLRGPLIVAMFDEDEMRDALDLLEMLPSRDRV